MTWRSAEERQRNLEEGAPLEFGHTLEDQIGGQIEVGFVVAGFYEDADPNDEWDVLGKYMGTYLATRALKTRDPSIARPAVARFDREQQIGSRGWRDLSQYLGRIAGREDPVNLFPLLPIQGDERGAKAQGNSRINRIAAPQPVLGGHLGRLPGQRGVQWDPHQMGQAGQSGRKLAGQCFIVPSPADGGRYLGQQQGRHNDRNCLCLQPGEQTAAILVSRLK